PAPGTQRGGRSTARTAARKRRYRRAHTRPSAPRRRAIGAGRPKASPCPSGLVSDHGYAAQRNALRHLVAQPFAAVGVVEGDGPLRTEPEDARPIPCFSGGNRCCVAAPKGGVACPRSDRDV